MRHFYRQAALTAALIACGPTSALAGARLYVATTGLDTNVCTRELPCRNLATAVNKATDDTEIFVLDTGAFGGSFTITKSISIYASVDALIRANTVPITINGVGIKVSIEGMTVNGAGGIKFANGALLSLRRVNVGGGGVAHNAPNGNLTMSDSVLRNASNCFIAQSPTPTARATIVNTRAEGCYFGFVAHGNSVVTVSHSSAAGNKPDSSSCYADFVALGDANGTGVMTVDDVVATNCYLGAGAGPLATGGNGKMTLGNSVISDVQFAKGAWGSSSCQTFGTNRVTNVTNAGTCGSITPQ